MMMGMLLAAIALGVATPACAMDGNTLLEHCTEVGQTAPYGQIACNNYIGGIIEGYSAALKSHKAPPERFDFEAPANMATQQAIDIVVKYLRDHPERRHLLASALIVIAMHEAFPAK